MRSASCSDGEDDMVGSLRGMRSPVACTPKTCQAHREQSSLRRRIQPVACDTVGGVFGRRWSTLLLLVTVIMLGESGAVRPPRVVVLGTAPPGGGFPVYGQAVAQTIN